MSNIVITTIMITLVILIFCCIYMLYRNNKVRDFQIKINHDCFAVVVSFLQSLKCDDDLHKQHCQYEMLKEKANEIIDKHSYISMLFSFKPLKLESWFTKEEIDFMNLNIQKGEEV